MKTFYQIVYHSDGDIWYDDMVYSTMGKAESAAESEMSSNPGISYYTINETEADDDEEADE